MQIQTRCQCGAKFAFSQDQIGDTFRCSICHQVFEVPAPGQKPVMTTGNAGGTPEKPAFTNAPHRYEGPSAGSSSSGCWIAAAIIGVLFLSIGGTFVSFFAATKAENSARRAQSRASAAFKVMQFDKLTKQYEEEGFERVISSATTSKTFKENTMFTGQYLHLDTNCEGDIAIFSQDAVLNGEVKGKVDFFGQRITIGEGAVIHGDVNLKSAQQVNVNGKVKGSLTGVFQTIVGKNNIEGELIQQGSLSDLIFEDAMNSVSGDWESDDDSILKEKIKQEVLEEIKEAKNALKEIVD